MAIVRFYGDLQRYGRKFKLDVLTAGEALKALMLQMPGLRQHIQNGSYRVRIDGKDIHEDEINSGMWNPLSSNAVVHIVPHLSGAKSGGLSSIIKGAFVVSVVFFGGDLGIIGWHASEIGMLVGGIALSIKGVTMMLTKLPPLGIGEGASKSNNSSFSNLDNSVRQGQAIPLCYGEMMIGSQVLSQGLDSI